MIPVPKPENKKNRLKMTIPAEEWAGAAEKGDGMGAVAEKAGAVEVRVADVNKHSKHSRPEGTFGVRQQKKSDYSRTLHKLLYLTGSGNIILSFHLSFYVFSMLSG
jgi:hypothetical protein